MTAQTNDPLSNFAYPQTPVVNPTTPTDPALVTAPLNDAPVPTPNLSQNLTTPISNDDSTRGSEITGPDPLPVDPSLMEAPTTPVSSFGDQFTPAPVQTPITEPTPAPTNEMPVEVPQEHDSPLQALAKKLAKLREELVQEVPQEPLAQTLENPLPIAQDTTTQVATPVPTEDPLALLKQSVADMSSAQNTPAPLPTPSVTPELPVDVNKDLQALENAVMNEMPVAKTDTPNLDVPLTTPQTSTSMTDQIVNQTNATTTSKLEQLYPEVVQKSDPTVAPDPTAMPDLANSAPVSTPVADPALATLSAPVVDEKTNVIDENDNSQVNPENVEVLSKGAKYPLSINKIMDIAIERNASDIQVSVGYPVMIRIDGTLIAVHDQVVSSENSEELIMPVLTEQKKELLEVNREVDLAYSPLQNTEARFRINAYYSKGNLTAAFRLIPSKIRTIEELQLPAMYNQLVKLGQGLVLVTGPTGHGKSTTLAAMLQSINLNRAVHMITIEDPIEYVFKPQKAVIDQREMHDDTHSWTVALKSALRQDPDVILVGEMRDYETIASTITLAETGHLVFATLHTNSASQTVDRIIDVFPENQQAQIRTQLSNILEAVVAQRLIPIDGGGRKAVSEIMLGTPAVRNLIREGKTHQLDNVIRTSADIGMVSLENSLVKLVREGLITMERAQEYAVHPEEVVRLLKS